MYSHKYNQYLCTTNECVSSTSESIREMHVDSRRHYKITFYIMAIIRAIKQRNNYCALYLLLVVYHTYTNQKEWFICYKHCNYNNSCGYAC